MYRLLSTRVVCSICRAAGSGDCSAQLRDALSRVVCINSQHNSCLYCSSFAGDTNQTGLSCKSSTQRTNDHKPQEIDVEEEHSKKKKSISKSFENLSSLLMAMSTKSPEVENRITKHKRHRDVLSPLRPLPQKKLRGKTRAKNGAPTSSSAIDFIPLPPSPPPPLPPPLPPRPPTPPEFDNDFFILDTTPSDACFHPASSYSSSRGHTGSNKENKSVQKKKSSKAAVTCNDDDDEVVYIPFPDNSRRGEMDYIPLCLPSNTQEVECIPEEAECIPLPVESDADEIECIPLPSESSSDDEPECIPLPGPCTINDSEQPEISADRNEIVSNKSSDSDFLDSDIENEIDYLLEKDIDILYEGPSKKKKDDVSAVPSNSQSPGSRLLETGRSVLVGKQFRNCHMSTELQSYVDVNVESPAVSEASDHDELDMEDLISPYSSRGPTPDIETESVVDLDVLLIDEQSLGSKPSEKDVIDVSGSDSEIVSDNEANNHSISSDDEGERLDISSSEYITLQGLKIKTLENTEIDLSDEVLDLRKKLEDLRKWETTGLGQEIFSEARARRGETMFTVMSYNVLAQELLVNNMYLYESCNEECLGWKYRWALLQHEITQMDPDVLLLQEVQASHYFSYYLPWLTYKGFEGIYKKRTGDKTDGCAIFFKTNKFSMLEHSSVEYRQPGAPAVLDRDNIGLIAKLTPVSQPNPTPLCVGTTHLLYNPRRHDVKLAQAVLFLTEMDRLAYEGESGGRNQYCPVIVTGDFNAEPHSTVLEFFKSGRLHYEGLSSKTLARHGTFGPLLGPELLPSTLGITDRCQHSVLAQSRFLEKRSGPIFSLSDKRMLEENLIRLYHSDRTAVPQRLPSAPASCANMSGWFSHDFNFQSAYRHRLARLRGVPEATTKQNQWTTVDYMLYSRVFSYEKNRAVEGPLKLLARYGLLSGEEAEKFSPLPSSVCPSDHFPLAAQFILKNR